MARSSRTVLLSCVLLFSMCVQSLAQNCSSYSFSSNELFASCISLPVLSSHLHWTFHPSNNTVDIAFRRTGAAASNWIAWGLNPSSAKMVGSQALMAYQLSNGTMRAYTTDVDSLRPSLQPGNISFGVPSIRAEYTKGDMIIFATLQLNSNLLSTNQVWQEGTVQGDSPTPHAMSSENMQSVGTINFQSEAATGGGNSKIPRENANCSSYTFSSNEVFAFCINLPVLSSYLHWTFRPSNNTVDIAFRRTGAAASNWIAWGLNPSSARMVGSQALMAYRLSNGTMRAYTTDVDSLSPSMQPGSISFGVPSIRAEYTNGDMIIFATLQLNSNLLSTNQVWQEGTVQGDSPTPHAMNSENMQSVGTINFQSGAATGGGNSKIHRKNVHGVLNAVSWGILMPIGIIIARYLKVSETAGAAWFYLHVACQSSAYVIGVAGWATGIKLGKDSPGITYHKHRNIGITLFCLGTLQVLALLLRPKPEHKYRMYWNFYHWTVGYAIIILAIINIYEGFDVLDGQKNWKWAYTGIIICLGAIAALLEAITWFIVLRRKKAVRSDKYGNGENGVNGYGNRSHQTV